MLEHHPLQGLHRNQLDSAHILDQQCYGDIALGQETHEKGGVIHGTVEYTVLMLPHVGICQEILCAFHGSHESRKEGFRREEEWHRTYQTPASLRVTAAGMTVAVTPLTSAQVKARGGPCVAFITFLQRYGKTPQVRDK